MIITQIAAGIFPDCPTDCTVAKVEPLDTPPPFLLAHALIILAAQPDGPDEVNPKHLMRRKRHTTTRNDKPITETMSSNNGNAGRVSGIFYQNRISNRASCGNCEEIVGLCMLYRRCSEGRIVEALWIDCLAWYLQPQRPKHTMRFLVTHTFWCAFRISLNNIKHWRILMLLREILLCEEYNTGSKK